MSDVLTRSEPLPAEAFSGNQVVIRAAPAMARFSLRARTAAEVSAVLGFEAPAKIGATAHGVACLGPDEWMYRGAPDAPPPVAAGQMVAITEISHRNTAIVVEGPRAAEVLSAGCPLDLSKFDIGRATRTVLKPWKSSLSGKPTTVFMSKSGGVLRHGFGQRSPKSLQNREIGGGI